MRQRILTRAQINRAYNLATLLIPMLTKAAITIEKQMTKDGRRITPAKDPNTTS